MNEVVPLPPVDLAMRVGPVEGEDRIGQWLETGQGLKREIIDLLPADWDWSGRRALDFGCGAGRVLRHFVSEASVGEFWGCDIDRASIDWMRERLCPPFHVLLVDEKPGLDRPDDYFDAVWAMSVFTHLTAYWSGWLLELHRILRPGGYLVATYLDAAMIGTLLGEASDEDCIGMNVLAVGRSWDEGGPWVFHSEWWLRAHWGRAFDVVDVRPGDPFLGTHGVIVMRKREATLTPAALESAEPGEERELRALAHNIEQLHAEDRRLRALERDASRRAAAFEAQLARGWLGRASYIAARIARRARRHRS